jgi:Flp pilus assembly pilin Flp
MKVQMLSLYVKASVALSEFAEKFQQRASEDEGLETTEYVLIAVAVAIGAFAAYKFLGTSISKYITGLVSSTGL